MNYNKQEKLWLKDKKRYNVRRDYDNINKSKIHICSVK